MVRRFLRDEPDTEGGTSLADTSALAASAKAADRVAAARVAYAFWDTRKCSPLADAGDIETITERVNGPAKLGLAERREATGKAMEIWPE